MTKPSAKASTAWDPLGFERGQISKMGRMFAHGVLIFAPPRVRECLEIQQHKQEVARRSIRSTRHVRLGAPTLTTFVRG